MSKTWGTPTWYFFHSLAEQIKEDDFPTLKLELFNIFKEVCGCLPCYDCTNHANMFIKTIRFNNIKTKEDFKKMLFTFHNSVNTRTGKPTFTNFDMYKASKLRNMFLDFKNVYSRNYNLQRGFMDTMYRKGVIENIKSFLSINQRSFIWL